MAHGNNHKPTNQCIFQYNLVKRCPRGKFYLLHFLNKFSSFGFLGSSVVKEFTCPCRRLRRLGFDPWVGKIPWRRKWQPIPVFLPGKSHGQRNLVGCSLWDCKESDITEHACMDFQETIKEQPWGIKYNHCTSAFSLLASIFTLMKV